MDKRVLLALGILAAAAGSPAFAEQVRVASEQVRVAGEKGKMLHVNRDALIQAIYRVALSPNGSTVGTKCVMKLGHNRDEARQTVEVAISIARKSRTAENFKMLVDGRLPAGIVLDARERALLTQFALANHTGTIWDGRTWEGSALKASSPTVWDGRTWEGSSM